GLQCVARIDVARLINPHLAAACSPSAGAIVAPRTRSPAADSSHPAAYARCIPTRPKKPSRYRSASPSSPTTASPLPRSPAPSAAVAAALLPLRSAERVGVRCLLPLPLRAGVRGHFL